MNEFLRQNYSLLTNAVIILSALVGVVLLKKYKGTVAVLFIYFLIYVVFVNFLGRYPVFISKYEFLKELEVYLSNTLLIRNYWWSTLFWKIGASLFFVFYYNKILKNEIFKNILRYSGYSFIIFSIAFIIISWPSLFLKSIPSIDIFGAIIVLECAFFYFLEILQNENILKFYRSLNFFISFAIFIWWLIITPLVFYQMYFTTSDWDFVFLRWQIYLFANVFMYTTFTVGLIISKPEKQLE